MISERIVDEVKDRGIDLLIIGRRDIGALKRTFVGSHSYYAIENCEVFSIYRLVSVRKS
jgi:nucleotide-binding universal stress UspA family protein